jgi:tetratricopeptide (TPR) repeat protein
MEDRFATLVTNFEKQQHEACLQELSSMDKNIELPVDIQRIKAYCLQKERRFEEAMGVWNVCIANDDSNAEYFAERGVCKFHLKFKSALSDLNMAVELDPENGYRYACRAYVKDKLGDTEGAVSDYTKSNELDPGNEITLNNLGLTEEKLGYTHRSRKRFLEVDDLLGIKTVPDLQPPSTDELPPLKAPSYEQPSVNKSVFSELKKMLSSTTGFRDFVRDARKMFK